MQFSLLYMKIVMKKENMNVSSVTAVQVHSYNVLTYRLIVLFAFKKPFFFFQYLS